MVGAAGTFTNVVNDDGLADADLDYRYWLVCSA